MSRSFKNAFSGAAIVHLAAVAVFVVVQLFLLGARPLKMKEDITMVDLSGSAGGGGEPGPVAPTPPEPKPPEIKPQPVDIPEPEPVKDDTISEQIKKKQKNKKPPVKPPEIKKLAQVTPPAKTNRVSKVVSNKPHYTAAQIRDMLNGSVRGIGSSPSGVRGHASVGKGFGNGLGGGGGGGGPDSPVAWYYAMVKQIMYEAWQQPSNLANAGRPVAFVTIRVKRDGTITDWQMTRPSGNALMDESVKRAVQLVKRLKPLPPQFIGPSQDIEITFEKE